MLALVCGAFAGHVSAQELIDAARHQNSAAVQSLLNDGADPDVRQADGATALHWAVYREDVDMVDALIEAGITFDMMIYPMRKHGIRDDEAQRHLYTTMLEFWDRTMK